MEQETSLAYRELVNATGTSGMEATLLATVNRLVAADEVFAFARGPDDAGDWLIQAATSGFRIDRQSPDHWRFRSADPLTSRLQDPQAPAVFVQTLQAQAITDRSYRQSCYERCDYSERISVCLKRDRRWYVMNVYRKRARPNDLVQSIPSLCDLVELAIPLLQLHRRLQPNVGAGLFSDTQAIRRRLEERFPGLADRELEVCALTISGFTAKSIARALEVSPATVMTYRRRAYAKLGISAAGSLVPTLLS